MRVTVTLTDGSVRLFEDQVRAGGSYETRVKYHDGWVEVIDVYDNSTTFPSASVRQVDVQQTRGWW